MTLVAGAIGPVGVSLDANGRVVIGGPGNTGIVGILCKSMPGQAMAGSGLVSQITAPGAMAGDVVDVMTDGEIADVLLVAGTTYWVDGVSGALGAGGVGGVQPGSGAGFAAGSKKCGWTVEATRLVVRMSKS